MTDREPPVTINLTRSADDDDAWHVFDNGGDWDDDCDLTDTDATDAAIERARHYRDNGRTVTVLRNGEDVSAEFPTQLPIITQSGIDALTKW